MITRARAVQLPSWAGKPVEAELGGWPVVTHFEAATGACGVGLTDLSHRPKAIAQAQGIDTHFALTPGRAKWDGQSLIACPKPAHAIIFDLNGAIEPQWPDSTYTDMTEGWVLLGIWGPEALGVMQRLITVDLEPRTFNEPLYVATGSHGIRVQVINLRTQSPGFIIACARSHGQNLFEACLRAGTQLNLKITGTDDFYGWLAGQRL
ncbi:MAG: Aminomethyltransferase folate-binding domain [Pseudomonadota bacterium]